MNLLAKEPLTPLDKIHPLTTNNNTKSNQTQLEKTTAKAIDAVIKQRTQRLQTAILDGFLGVDDNDPYRITRLIRKLIEHKPDIAVRLLTKLLPSVTDEQLKQYSQPAATINIINQNGNPQTQPLHPQARKFKTNTYTEEGEEILVTGEDKVITINPNSTEIEDNL